MAGTIYTDLVAVRDALIAGDQTGAAGLTVGVDPFAAIDNELKQVKEMHRRVTDLKSRMTAGSAKTLIDTVLADLA